MKKKFTLIYLLLFVSISLAIGYLVFFNLTYNKITSSFKVTEKKYDFLESSNLLLTQINNLESYHRGFLLTNSQEFFSQYNKDKYQLNLEKERFYKLVKRYGLENEYPAELETLKLLISQKIKDLETSIEIYKKGNKKLAVDLITRKESLSVTNDIKKILEKLNIDNKYKETKAKQFIYEARATFQSSILIVLSTIIVVLLFLVFYIKKYVDKNS